MLLPKSSVSNALHSWINVELLWARKQKQRYRHVIQFSQHSSYLLKPAITHLPSHGLTARSELLGCWACWWSHELLAFWRNGERRLNTEVEWAYFKASKQANHCCILFFLSAVHWLWGAFDQWRRWCHVMEKLWTYANRLRWLPGGAVERLTFSVTERCTNP